MWDTTAEEEDNDDFNITSQFQYNDDDDVEEEESDYNLSSQFQSNEELVSSEDMIPHTSNPWLRKPLWALEDWHHNDDNNNDDRHQKDHNENGIEMTSSPLVHETKEQQEEQINEVHHTPQEIQATSTTLPRHLTLLDLISIGVGGTIGSGIFVLCGLVAKKYAGPSTCLSWTMAGGAAFLSGCCYAELSGRIPHAGSSYVYAFVSMGELPAFLTGSCLVLEFLVSGSAVARSWGDKVVEWLTVELHADKEWVYAYLQPGYGINPMAFLVSCSTTLLLLGGVKESKMITDIFTWIKVALVLFMAIGGLLLLDTNNLQPFMPPELNGWNGIMRGATTSFFGYLGYDGICCVAGEAINPTVNLPKAVMYTLIIVTALYVVAALALTGMQNYTEISVESGFPEAFASRGVMWAAQLTAAGEVITLPIVVLISGVLQPRLQYALARDGLLPHMFCEVTPAGNLRKGTIVAGTIMTFIATFVPFEYLDDFVSAGILVAFSITNSSLVIMRRESPENTPFYLEKLLLLFNGLSFLSAVVSVHGPRNIVGKFLAFCFIVATAAVGFWISWSCPSSAVFGGKSITMGNHKRDNGNQQYFQTPFVPLIPCLGTFINWFLIAQLDFLGIFLLLCYFSLATMFYFHYGAKNSFGNNIGWDYPGDLGLSEDNEEGNNHAPSATCIENKYTIT